MPPPCPYIDAVKAQTTKSEQISINSDDWHRANGAGKRDLSSWSAVGETTEEVGLTECHYNYLNLINKH